MNTNNKKYVGRLIYSVLAGNCLVREAIKNFPEDEDKNLICAYHALVHYEADENIRYHDIEYREAQDEYLEYIAQTLCSGKDLPKNIIDEYKPYYKGRSNLWQDGFKWAWKEFKRFINI